MSRRKLSDDERTLWHGVTRSIAPMRKALRRDPASAEPAIPAPPKPRSKPKASPAKPNAAPVATPAPPPLAPLGRRMRKRVARGAESIDARLDLHGLTQAEAHGALHRFLHSAQARGCRLVLVITGKGGGGDPTSERGVLKRQVPLWLRLPELRSTIVGFEPAGIGHGGEGALYVRLKRAAGSRD